MREPTRLSARAEAAWRVQQQLIALSDGLTSGSCWTRFLDRRSAAASASRGAAYGQVRPGTKRGHQPCSASSEEGGQPFLDRELDPELFQLAVDPLQLGPRLPFPQITLTMPGADEILDLAAEQPQPGVPVDRGGRYWSLPVRIAAMISLRYPTRRAVLSLSVAPLARPSSLSPRPVDCLAGRLLLAAAAVHVGSWPRAP